MEVLHLAFKWLQADLKASKKIKGNIFFACWVVERLNIKFSVWKIPKSSKRNVLMLGKCPFGNIHN